MALPQIKTMRPYVPGMTSKELALEREVSVDNVIRLASNESNFGFGDNARKAIESASKNSYFYADGKELIGLIADKYSVGIDQVILGNGSTDVLDMVSKVFLSTGKEAIYSEFSFAMFKTFTAISGAMAIVAKEKDFCIEPDEISRLITDKTRVIWIANPNNPTGTFISYHRVKRFLEIVRKDILVVLDEAYYEYLSENDREDSHEWVKEHPNLLIVRTFSKVHGLAGLRIGYGIGSSAVIELLNRVRQTRNVNNIAVEAAAAAMDDQDHIDFVVKENKKELRLLKKKMDKLGLEYLPAYGNFLTVKFQDASIVHEKLLDTGIIVRPLKPYGMHEHLRITVGTHKQNEKLVTRLSQILA